MMRPFPVEFSVSAAGCIAAALMVLVLPLPWLAAVAVAAIIHEGCHLLCLKLCRICVYRIHVGLHGAAIQTAALSPTQELVCAAAGPVGSFLCLAFTQSCPLLALCGFLQGIYNLIPVYPLDGGRILHAGAELLIPKHAESICKFFSRYTIAGIFITCAALYFRTFRPFFLLIAGYFLFGTVLSRKTPCKEG